MRFKAWAKTPGACCWYQCKQAGDKIYSDGEYKYLTCCAEHARLARKEVDKVPDSHKYLIFERK